MRITGHPHLLRWCSGILLVLSCQTSLAAPGYDVAMRHAVNLSQNSAPVVGNGEVGCLLRSPAGSRSFLEGTVTGEHWKCSPSDRAVPAERVSLLGLTLEIQPVDPAVPSLPPFLMGAVYRLDQNLITNRFQTGNQVLSATFTVAPTRNLFVLSGKSSFPVNLKMTATIPDPGLAETYLFSASGCVEGNRASFALTQDLPRMESFGVALRATGGPVRPATLERGISLEMPGTQNWLILLQITSLQDNLPLLPVTLAEAKSLAATPEASLTQERIEWWRLFWNHSVLDMQGSTHPDATLLERTMVCLQHGMATHTRGRFPPGDCGLGEQHEGGRPWHSTLWPLYRGWILTGHVDQVNCLGYPLLLPEQETLPSREAQALLPSESGPDAVPSASAEALGEALLEIGLVSDQYPWNETGRLFSTIPLLQSLPNLMENRPEEASAVYPFLFRNANRAMAILSATDALTQLDPSLIPHLSMAVKGALDVAAEIEIDAPTRKKWMACLEAVRAQAGQGKNWPDFDQIRHLPDTVAGIGQVEGFLAWFAAQQTAPEGVLLNSAGGRSLLKTGWALGKLVDLLLKENNGVYHLLPGLTPDGSWSLQWENIGLEDGSLIPALTLERGILDSFLLRPARNGPVRFGLPPNWTSAKVAMIGPSQEAIEVKTTPERVAEFTGKSGQDYLVGPVW